MGISKQWLTTWQEKRHLLASPVDLNEYFEKSEIAEKSVKCFSAGKASFPTGAILARDPLVYLADEDNEPYMFNVPAGDYDVIVSAVEDDGRYFYAAAKIDITDKKAVRYEEALVGIENLEDFKIGEYFGFNVDAGLGCLTDVKVAAAYKAFEDKNIEANPDFNIHDDCLGEVFAESAKKYPEFQREGGDYINWTIPGTDYNLVMVQSGFGDGAYPVYYGYDENEEIACVVMQFIDIELAFGENNDDEEDYDEE